MESTICIRPYGANPRPGGQTGGNSLGFHLQQKIPTGSYKNDFGDQKNKKQDDKNDLQLRGVTGELNSSPSSISGGRPPTNTFLENRSRGNSPSIEVAAKSSNKMLPPSSGHFPESKPQDFEINFCSSLQQKLLGGNGRIPCRYKFRKCE